MQRKVFDKLASATGTILVVVLLVAGGLLTWGHSYVNSNIHSQLAPQQIAFPTKAVWTQKLKADTGGKVPAQAVPYLIKYAGQPVTSGPQAQAYANYLIAYDMRAMPYHGVFSQIATALFAAKPGSPQATQLAALKQTSFMGTTLRGMLVEAYGFWKVGEIMLWGAIASFILAALMAALVGGGLWHARRTSEQERIFNSHEVSFDSPGQALPTA